MSITLGDIIFAFMVVTIVILFVPVWDKLFRLAFDALGKWYDELRRIIG